MSKLTSEQKEFSMLGAFVGLLVALRLYITTGPEIAVVGAIGCILAGFVIGYWLHGASDRPRFMVQYGIEGIMVGIFVGAVQLGMRPAAIIEAALIGAVVYGLGVASLALRQKNRDRYLSFKGEAFMVSFFGLLGAFGGSLLADLLAKNKLTHFVSGSPENIASNIILIFIGSLLLSVTIGMLVSSNRKRPAIGAVFTIIAGCLVLWVGISIAPILFMPGSGLYWAGLIVGLILIGLGLLIISFPQSHTYLGLAVVVFSILSFVGAAGGLIIGGLFGLLGGTLIVSWMGLENQTVLAAEQRQSPE